LLDRDSNGDDRDDADRLGSIIDSLNHMAGEGGGALAAIGPLVKPLSTAACHTSIAACPEAENLLGMASLAFSGRAICCALNKAPTRGSMSRH